MPPDEFVLDLLDFSPGAVLRVLNEQQQALKSPAMSLEQLMDRLQTNGLLRSMTQARLLLAT